MAVHVLIEVFEYHAASKIKLNRMLTGKLAPFIGGAVGIIPQCGFSVVAANLYAKRNIRLGTLIAVFIATSDEAIPILLSDVSAAYKLLPLLAFKLAFAVGVGYLVNALTRKNAVIAVKTGEELTVSHGCHGHEIGEHTHDANHKHKDGQAHDHANHKPNSEHSNERTNHTDKDGQAHDHAKHPLSHAISANYSQKVHVDDDDFATAPKTVGAAPEHSTAPIPNANQPRDAMLKAQHAHAQQGKNTLQGINNKPAQKTEPTAKKFDFACFVVHPLVHTLTVLGFILAVNLALGFLLYFVGEARLQGFMQSARYAQPFLAALIGLIPNCASSVVITQLYASGTLSMGAAFAGLCVNAGLGLAVLVKENKNAKENLLIVLFLYASSSIIGLFLSFLPL